MTIPLQNTKILTGRAWRQWLRGRTMRVFAVRSLGMVALLGFEITMARWLGVAKYGTFSFALTIAAILSRLVPLGWLNASTRLVSAFASSARFGLLKGTIILAHVATGLGLAAGTLLLVIIWGVLGSGLEMSFPLLRYVLSVAVVLAFLELHRHILRGLQAGDLGEALIVLFLPALVTMVVWILEISEPGEAIYVYGAICLSLVLFSTLSIARRLPAPTWKNAAEFRIREWSLAALAILLGSASDELTTRIAVIVLGSLGNEQEVGLYAAAARLALMNVFVLRALTPVAAPRISILYHEGRLVELRAMFWRLCVLSLIGALPTFLIFMLFPEIVLRWFGREFAEATEILRVLSLGYLASAAAGPCATALMMIGRERIYGVLAFAALVLSALGNYVLAQTLGGLGAAIATAGVMVLNNAVYIAIFFYVTVPSRVPIGSATPPT
jgi:O-antigen/teichoic acid export membrane protein